MFAGNMLVCSKMADYFQPSSWPISYYYECVAIAFRTLDTMLCALSRGVDLVVSRSMLLATICPQAIQLIALNLPGGGRQNT